MFLRRFEPCSWTGLGLAARWLILLAACFPLPFTAGADPGEEFFEKQIRPLLVSHCYECHSADARKLKGGLLLDSREGWQRGGDSGHAIIPGKPDQSRLIEAVRYVRSDLEMPPKGRLSEREIALLVEWVGMGAPDSRRQVPVASRPPQRGLSLEEGRNFWSYKPPAKAALPPVKDTAWPRRPLDRFILARLEQEGLTPAGDTTRTSLVRRVHFDLTGLPPDPAQIDRFLEDPAPDALARLVDELLQSPRFGERWGRHWLDVARFGESVTLRGLVYQNAWRYRDYVIDAFNGDMPYDQFVREQVAGDLFQSQSLPDRQRQMIATGFLTLGNINLEVQDKTQLDMDVVDEQLDVLSKAFLAQTVTCARCHDHKFDPIPTRDYYAMAGILKGANMMRHANVSGWVERPLPLPDDEVREYELHDQRVAEIEGGIKEARARASALAKPPVPADGSAEADDPEGRAARAKQAAAELKDLELRLKQLKAEGPKRPLVMTVEEKGAGDIRVHVRGSVHTLGEPAPRGFLQVATQGRPAEMPSHESGRRELADWLVSPGNPLTARVMVNRVWHWLLGTGIVPTTDNFGTTGQTPSHPELLDWLAIRFQEEGWSIKWLVKEIMLSRVYQLSSAADPAGVAADPLNKLRWRSERRRLEAEAIRDSMLAISGQLSLEMGGRTFPDSRQEDYSYAAPSTRRSVYLPVFRNALPELFEAFDFANSSMVTGTRNVSTVAPQALFLLNHPFVREQAGFAARRYASGTRADRIITAYRATLGRGPSEGEMSLARNHVGTDPGGGLERWTDLYHALFSSMDFRYLD